MAVCARHRQVPSSQSEVRLLVLYQCECRGLVGVHIVAAVAGIEIRRRGKLLRVAVAVTVRAVLEFHFE